MLAAVAAAIVPQQGIRGVRLDMTRAAVVAKLGAPTRTIHGKNELYAYTELRYPGLRVTFAFNRTVSQVESTVARDRTARGAGVGSTKSALTAKVDGLQCETRHCWLGSFTAGKVVTDFFLANGRVSRVVVGRVLD